MSENQTGVTVTLKAGTGFESPWIVIHAESTDDALKQIDSGSYATLAERTVAAAEFFRAAHNVKTGLAAQDGGAAAHGHHQTPQPAQGGWNAPAQTPPPAFAQPAAASAAPMCTHGQMVYREAKPGSGKNWKAYFCPTPQGTPGQCKAQFL